MPLGDSGLDASSVNAAVQEARIASSYLGDVALVVVLVSAGGGLVFCRRVMKSEDM